MINLKNIPLGWLLIGLISLAISGLFSIVLAIAWHPSVKSAPIFATLFQRSLIAHVNLSITIWFLCCTFMLMSYQHSQKIIIPYLDKTSKILIFLVIGLISVTSLLPSAVPILCNYIPLLNHQLFFIALALTMAAIILKILEFTFQFAQKPSFSLIAHNNIVLTTLLCASIIAFIVSGIAVRSEINFMEDPLIYGEMLFWGGGHIVQYAWVQIMLIAWVLMLQHLGFACNNGLKWVFYSNLIAVITAPIPYLLYPVTSGDFRELFTLLMAWISGIAPILFIIYYVTSRKRLGLKVIPPYRDMVSASLWWSLLLFALGGVFAVMIDGINVKIPAHYHGSLLGVTVALMGLTYLLLQTNYGDDCAKRLGFWQPALLGVGQVMHIVGLFWSGGYGVQRKSPLQGGKAIELAELPLRIQSTGGGIAIIGGLLFLIVCIKIYRNKNYR
jgi:cytochrome c oxidase subunit I